LDLDIFKNDDRANTFVICSVNSSTSRKADILKLGGIKIIPVETEDNGLLNLDDAFAKLYKDFDISSLLIEGGSTVHSYLAEKEYIDELHIFIAPKIIGDGMKSFKKLISKSIDLSKKYKLIELENFDGDIHAIFIKE